MQRFYFDAKNEFAKNLWRAQTFFVDLALPPDYAHHGGIATSSVYKYTMVLYLDIQISSTYHCI